MKTTKLFAMVAIFATLLFASCKKEETIAAPVASFTIAPSDTIGSNDSLTLTNTSTGADSYLWNFGDGTTSTLQNPTKSFDDSYREICDDTFTITLTATKDGKSATTSKNVVVYFCL